MKLLVLYQARDSQKDHPGHYDGFERLVAEGVLDAHAAIPYYGVAEARGWDALWNEAYNVARDAEVDAVFLQFFHGPIPDPTVGIQRLKGLPSKPTIFTSLGDPFGRWANRIPQSYRIASRLADVNFLTGMGYLAQQLVACGSRNLVLMPNGCCQVRFGTPLDPANCRPEFDVVFVGSRMTGRNPLGHFSWVGRRRAKFVADMTRRFGRKFGLFGKGWEGNPSWQGPVPYEQQHPTQRRGAVVLGGMPNGYHDYYTSDRVLISIASAIPFVDYWVRGVECIFKPEVDWWLARDTQGMFQHCDRLLAMSIAGRQEIGRQAREHILAAHTQYHRCRQMVEIVRDLRLARQRGIDATEPRLPFLAKATSESPPAVVNWKG